MKGRIYTKTGDNGTTSLFGGSRVSKHHIRLEAYGTLDELNSFIGLIRDMTIDETELSLLLRIQNQLFSIGSELADEQIVLQREIPVVSTEAITQLEKQMDIYLEALPDLKQFILQGGAIASSYCHIARTVCRRAERAMICMAEQYFVSQNSLVYINRLSDFLFVLARKKLKDVNKIEIQRGSDLDKII